MTSFIKNIEKRIFDKLKFGKIYVLFFLMIFFSILYMLLDDSHFEGVNKFKEIVKEEVIKDKVQEKIKETFKNDDIDNYYSKNKIIKKQKEEEEEVMENATKEIEKETEKIDFDPEMVQPSNSNKYLNRLYFAIVTGCLLGYGDIYPISLVSKLLTSMQGLLTIILIIY